MLTGMVAGLTVLALLLTVPASEAATPTVGPILSGPLAKLDIKDAEIETVRGTPKGTLTIAQHFALDPGWLDPLEHAYVLTQHTYDDLRWGPECCRRAKGFTAIGTPPRRPIPIPGRSGRCRK